MTRQHAPSIVVLCGLLGCASPAPTQLDEAQRQLVIREVQQRLDQYAAAVTGKELDAILSFWSDSDDFVFAGDGSILGGFNQWAALAKQDNEQAERWVYWNWRNVHILPLSRDAASATLEFEYEKVLLQGDTVQGHGSWTYVMKRTDAGWQVYQGNGHHIAR